VTASLHPGTTLGMIPFTMPAYPGCRVFDTPGVVNEHSVYLRLLPREIKLLHPYNKLRPITYRLLPGKCIILGALCSLELLEGPGYFFTIFASNDCTIHKTDVSKSESVIEKLCGTEMWPPVDKSRLGQFSQVQKFVAELDGIGSRSSVVDVVFPGVGWIAITGSGRFKIRATAPEWMKVGLRQPLCLFETWTNYRKNYLGIPSKRDL